MARILCTAKNDVVSEKLFALFERFAGSEVFFVEPGGNYGDHLIYRGAYKLAKLAGIRVRILDFLEFQNKAFLSQDVIYVHGGGGFVPWWSGKVMKILRRLSREFSGVVILGPTTFSDNETYISQALDDCVGSNRFREFFIFTRERLSCEILKRHLPGQAEIICDHDAALNLVKADLLSGKSPEGKYVFYAMRYDQERPSAQPYNYLMWLDPVEVCFTFEKWLSLHLQARRLITNRTHSAILGSILGIPTVLLPNNYHKNRSVWEFSLQDRGVQWRDHLACRGMNALIESNKFLRQGFSSPNYKRVLKLRLNYLGF